MMEIVSNVISDLWVNLSDTIFESYPNRPQQLNLLVAFEKSPANLNIT